MSSYYGLILVSLTALSGVIWLVDSFTAGKARKQALKKLQDKIKQPTQEQIDAVAKEPVHVDYAKSFFPILLIIVVLRSFLWEPFQIPSASMKPTLLEGDFILVNKFNYGLHMPVTGKKFLSIGLPKRGDVAVFKSPVTGEDYIKRVVGLPGDTVIYTADKQLQIIPACPDNVAKQDCPKTITVKKVKLPDMFQDINPKTDIATDNFHFIETLGDVEHETLNHPDRYAYSVFQRKVPAKSYFVMGDNRDNSHDSRAWGFVPQQNLVGEAVAIWLHLDFGIKTKYFTWVPTGVDFGRVSAIK